MEEDFNLKPFFKAVRDFFIASLKKMLKKLPFGDSILKDLIPTTPVVTPLVQSRAL